MNADNDTLMNPLQLIREQPDAVRAMLDKRHFAAPLDRIVELDTRSRALRAELEQLRAERNKASKGGPPSEAVKVRMRELGDRIKAIEAELGPLEAERDELVLHIPNVVDPAAPLVAEPSVPANAPPGLVLGSSGHQPTEEVSHAAQ